MGRCGEIVKIAAGKDFLKTNSTKRNVAFVFTFISGLVLFGQNIDNTMLDSAISEADKLISTDNRSFFRNLLFRQSFESILPLGHKIALFGKPVSNFR